MTIQSPQRVYIKKGVRAVVTLVWAMAAAAIAFVMAPSQLPWETLLAVCIAGVAAFFWARGGDFFPTLAACPWPLAVVAVFLVWRLLVAGKAFAPYLASYTVLCTLPSLLAIVILLLAALFMVLVVFWLLTWLWQGLRAYWAAIDSFEIIFFGTFASFLTVMIGLVYQVTNGYWASVDVVFSIDSGLVSEHMLPVPTYADLRHSVYSFLFWPLSVWFNDLAAFTPAPDFTVHVLWGILGAWMLLGMALLLYRLSGRQRHVALIYMMTMPVWLFCFFVEKYQPACPLALLTVAALVGSDPSRAARWGVAATGCMTSTAPLLLACLVTRSPREFAKRAGGLLCSGLGLLAVSGRLHILLHLSEYWQDVHQFTEIDLTFQDRIRCYFNSVYACVFPLSHRLYEGRLYWQSVGAELRLMGVVILFLAVVGFIFRRREKAYRLFFVWLLFQPLFFIVFAWSPLESPLFALYFSWAVVPLFCAGVQGFFARTPRLFVAVMALLCGTMIFMNVPQWLTIFSLLRQLYPVG